MLSKYKLTVGIISYNRPHELLRTLNSLMPLPDFVEVLICDDKSPKIDEIVSFIDHLISRPNIKFVVNDINLGYDRNLFRIFELSSSNIVLLLGDDDYLEYGALENVLNFIDNTADLKCAFLQFRDLYDDKVFRNYNSNFYFNKNVFKYDGSFIYNSILFSGLIFSKNEIINNFRLFEKYFNSIYIQVAFFIYLNSKYGSYFINGPGVIIGGDGESGFGYNEASVNTDIDLKDRSTVLTNLIYHKRLFNVLNNIQLDIDSEFLDVFMSEYKIRSIKALFNARKHGRLLAKEYWKGLSNFNISGIYWYYPFYLLIYILPNWFLDFLFRKVEFYFLKFRAFKFFKNGK